MTQRDLPISSRDDLEKDIRILRAALVRLGGEVLAKDILRASRDQDDHDPEALDQMLQQQEAPLVPSEKGGTQAEVITARKCAERVSGEGAGDPTTMLPMEDQRARRLRRFLDDLGRLSAHHGVWIENGARGTLLHDQADFAAGYIAWPGVKDARAGVFEIDCYVRGARLEGEDCVRGDDHSPDGKAERAHAWREENAQALAAQAHQAESEIPPSSALLSSKAREVD